MTVITIDNASFCHGAEVARAVARGLGYELIEDEDVFARAANSAKLNAAELRRVVDGPSKILGGLRDDRPRQIAAMRMAVAELLAQDSAVLYGSTGYLIPGTLTHVLKVCLAGTRDYRLKQATLEGASRKKAEQMIKRNDEGRAAWTDLLLGREPWDKRLFDMILPVHELTLEQVTEQILENAQKTAVATTDEARAALHDFDLAARVQLSLAEEGHDVDVQAKAGAIEIQIKKHTLFLDRLQQQLVDAALRIPGVSEAQARPGPRYQEANIYVNLDTALPKKVLLVDDEQAFVQTLSARLQTREIESSVAYGGAQALAMIKEEEPEVMVLDLKMPGVDGLEVLRNVKTNNPKTEVIILTAHGTEAEERLVFQMGAFAYLRKPVDISELTETMRLAYQKVQQNKDGVE